MRSIIEFCASNMHYGTDEIMKKLEANPDYDVIEYGCLGNCGECSAMPFAMVNGEIVTADSVAELEARIGTRLHEDEERMKLLEDL